MKTIKLIFPHQLFEFNPVFSIEGSIYLVEERLFFNHFNFHKQKIAFHRASMKYYERFLLKRGSSVTYIEAHKPEADIRILIHNLKDLGFESVLIVDPVDNWLLSRITKTCQKFKIESKFI